MSLMTSLMYAAAAVALLAVALECCCRRRMRQFRDDLNIAALNGQNMNAVPYPVGAAPTAAPTAPPYPVARPIGANRPPMVVYPMPVPPHAICQNEEDFFFRSYATTPVTQTQNTSETPPPSYEQVMANVNELPNTQKPRPG